MPIDPTTIFFEDYFGAVNPLDSYKPTYYDPPDTRGYADDRFEIRRGEGPSGEDCLRWVTGTLNCPGCQDNPPDCGTLNAACFYSRQAARIANGGGINLWRHFRTWVRPTGVWNDAVNEGYSIAGHIVHDPNWVIPSTDWTYWDITLQDDGTVLAGHPWLVGIPPFGTGFWYTVPLGTWASGEWFCVELARRFTQAAGLHGELKAWFNDALVFEGEWDVAARGYTDGFKNSKGFYVGGWGGGPAGFGLTIDYARIAWADGPIGCGTRAGLPPDEVPDPDALRCTSADDYATADEVRGECGRALCYTGGKTREGWETNGAGFPSAKSLWYKWVAPRSGRFIWRTRGSEVFNEVGVYRHTGATPPPLLQFSDVDPWDPEATTSSAVEVNVEQGVEYRIRVASASEGWTILDHGPAKQLILDDGWSVSDTRATRTRVPSAGTVSGLAVEDDQVAAASNGAGAEETFNGFLFGAFELSEDVRAIDPGGNLAIVRGIVRIRGTGSGAGVWHVGLFVDGVQRAHRAFVNKTFETLEFGLIQLNRGEKIDVRLYRLAGEATAPAQIAEWRLESLSHLGCNPYTGGPLEGGTAVSEDPNQDELNARFIAHLDAVAAGEVEGGASGTGEGSNFIDPSEWSAEPEDPPPPWESTNDPLDPGPGADFQFTPNPP